MVCGWGFVLLQILPFQPWCKKSRWTISLEWWQLTIIEALFVVSLHSYTGGTTCLVEVGRSGVDCTECDCELRNRAFPLSFSLSRHLFLPFLISIAHGFIFSQARKKFLAFLTCVPLGSIQSRMVVWGKRLSGKWENVARRCGRIVFVIQYRKSSFQSHCCSFIR